METNSSLLNLRQDIKLTKKRLYSVIASVFILSVVANNYLSQNENQNKRDTQDRGIASIERTVSQQDVRWEQELAKDIETKFSKNRQMVVGKTPNERDQLIYGELEGAYLVKYSSGKVDSFKIRNQNTALSSQSKLLNNHAEFLMKYRNVFSINFDSVRVETAAGSDAVVSETQGELNIKRFALYDSNQNKIGEAKFNLNESGQVEGLVFIRK